MNTKLYFAVILTLIFTVGVFGQRPPGGGGNPGHGGPPRGDQGPPRGDDGQFGRDGRPGDGRRPMDGPRDGRPDGPPNGDWIRPHDTNDNGTIEADEFQSAVDRTFADLDRDHNGIIESSELPPPPREGRKPGQDGKNMLPPFFFEDQIGNGANLSKADFDRIVRGVFNDIDKNHDGSVSKTEARQMPLKEGQRRPEMAPNARFIAAELRFGDKLIKGQPFSADIVIEDTRRLYDGSTVTKQSRGVTYRDGEGRTRREQPLEMVGGIGIVGTDNKPQTLVFINDFATKSQIFLDLNNKIARKGMIGGGEPPREPGQPEDAKTESLGTKVIEGVSAEGTRVTFEIPAGQIGNDKPIQVISERWYSPELQVLVMSRHLDPLAGEHVFKLVNIIRSEPSADLFTIPSGFKIEDRKMKDRED